MNMIHSAKQWLPEIPVALCSDCALGPEDVLIVRPDNDTGGRIPKIGMYDLSPPEWDTVLYLDADTKIVADVRFLFELIEDGWDLALSQAVVQELYQYPFIDEKQRRRTRKVIGALRVTQYSSGVMAFGRNEQTADLFATWRAQWHPRERRDQAALARAIYRCPVRVYTLGYEWNTVAEYARKKHITTAGVMHYPMRARRKK